MFAFLLATCSAELPRITILFGCIEDSTLGDPPGLVFLTDLPDKLLPCPNPLTTTKRTHSASTFPQNISARFSIPSDLIWDHPDDPCIFDLMMTSHGA